VKKIFLVGLPGSGKSTLGRQLGEFLSLKFIDLDVEIEKVEGKRIKDIFHEQGEQLFRKIEHDTFLQFIENNQSFILATGGGTPCFFDHMERMNKSGLTVYLSTPVEMIVERIKENEDRPLMEGVDVRTKISSLLDDREQFYEKAALRLEAWKLSFEEIKQVIEKAARSRFS
jgi:shikimate kinase